MTVHGISPDGAKLLGFGSIPVPLATVAVILRFVVRHRSRSIGVDDYSILVALLLYYVLYAFIVAWVVWGMSGWTQSELDLTQIERFFKMFFYIQLFYALVGPATKISILLMYRRVFSVVNLFLWATVVVGALVVAWCVSVFFTVIFQCTPVDGFWEVTKPSHCIDSQKFYWANGVSNLLLDFIVLVLPLSIVWRLQMPTKSKFLASGVFSLGLFVCIASVLRITTLWHIDWKNTTGSSAIPAIWTSLEPGFGIVACCLPMIPHLFSRDRFRSGHSGPVQSNPSGFSGVRSRLGLSKSGVDETKTSRPSSSQYELHLNPSSEGTTFANATSTTNWQHIQSPAASSQITREITVSVH